MQKIVKPGSDIVIFKFKRPQAAQSLSVIGIDFRQPKKQKEQLQEKNIQEAFLGMNLNDSEQVPAFLLQKIDPEQFLKEIDEKPKPLEFVSKSQQNFRQTFEQIREDMINTSRSKIKFVDLKQEDFVDFNGKRYHYEDLGNQVQEDYYIIKRNPFESKIDNQLQKRVYIPKEYEEMMDEVGHFQLETNTKMDQDDKQDSNREDRSEYDYPDEESSQRDDSEFDSDERNSRSSGEIIMVRDDHADNDEHDSQQLYRKYLERCKNYVEEDDELYEC